jgi:hypothetical protein
VVPDQFHIGLAPEDAMAACGPVAAIAFAQVYGRNPTPAEALQLAKQSGWTAEGGMNGISNEKRLLDKMGLPSQLEMGANWDHIRASALQHQPVILSTPGHYYVVDGYDAKTGAYHVGQSGKVYRGGSDWLTPEQIAGLSGSPSGALFTVHPLIGGSAGQREVLPPLDLSGGAAGQRQGLQPQRELLPPQREVLPPLDLGNTPPPPPIVQPGSSTMVAASIGDARPIGETSGPPVTSTQEAASPATAAADPVPAPVAAAAADPPTLVAAPIPDEPPPVPGPPPTPLTATPPVGVPAAATSAPLEPTPPLPVPSTTSAGSAAASIAPVEPVSATTAPVEPDATSAESAGPVAATYTLPDSDAAPPKTFTLPDDSPAAPPPKPQPQSEDPQARSAIPPGIAIGAVAAGTPRPQEPPPPPPRRRPEDELDPP